MDDPSDKLRQRKHSLSDNLNIAKCINIANIQIIREEELVVRLLT
jgi:hypothetical protein